MKELINHNNGVLEIILTNQHLKVHLVNVGASIFKMFFNGADVIVGPKDIDLFIKNDHYYGKTIGRFSGRLPISFSTKTLKDIKLKPYKSKLATIHGGINGASTKNFKYEETTNDEVVFTTTLKEEEDNLPGDVYLKVTYQLKENELSINYQAKSTKTTLLNITNHSYFNLDRSKTINNHQLSIDSDMFVLFDQDYNIKDLKNVKDTVYDFRKPKTLKKTLKELKESSFKGLDTVYKLNKNSQINLSSLKNNSNLKITTNYPSVVVYTHNDDSPDGLDYFKLHPQAGIALECLYEPGGLFHEFLNDAILKEKRSIIILLNMNFL